ncbi:putative transcriptional regulator [Clostridium sp. CAG:1193]|nr:putative transcriptional regulator [Clostridium sp. CAG:1193]
MDQEKIGKFIKEERKNKKLSQEELGELLGVSNRSISKWETGVSLPDISLFKPLCEVLDISYNELLSGERLNKTNYQERLEDNLSNVISYASKKDNKFNDALILLMVLSTFLSIYFINVNNKVWIPLSFIAIIILIYILRNNIIKYSLMLFEKIKNNTYIFNILILTISFITINVSLYMLNNMFLIVLSILLFLLVIYRLIKLKKIFISILIVLIYIFIIISFDYISVKVNNNSSKFNISYKI